MKYSPALRYLSVGLLLLSIAACDKKAGTCPFPKASDSKPVVSAESTSFNAVARHLDPGGSMYFYLSTEKFLKSASEMMGTLGTTIVSNSKMDAAQKAKAESSWQSFSRVLLNSGIKDISGLGGSSIALEPNFSQSKWMVHHNEAQGKGLIWQISGSTPNALDFVSYLPERTAMASSGNLKIAPIWNALNQEAANNPDLRQGMDAVAQKFEQSTGLNLPAVLASLGPNYSMVVTLDPTRATALPVMGPDGQPVSIPEPGLAIFIQVQDEVLIKRLDEELSKIPSIIKADEADLKLRTFALPIPAAYLRPTIAWKQGLVILGSSDALIREMMDVKGGKKPGFAANAGFKKLLAGLPTSGCSFGYVAPSFRKTIQDLQLAQLNATKTADPAPAQIVRFIQSITPVKEVFAVTQETVEGWISTSHEITVPAEK